MYWPRRTVNLSISSGRMSPMLAILNVLASLSLPG
jgi:hypothetical protein